MDFADFYSIPAFLRDHFTVCLEENGLWRLISVPALADRRSARPEREL